MQELMSQKISQLNVEIRDYITSNNLILSQQITLLKKNLVEQINQQNERIDGMKTKLQQHWSLSEAKLKRNILRCRQ